MLTIRFVVTPGSPVMSLAALSVFESANSAPRNASAKAARPHRGVRGISQNLTRRPAVGAMFWNAWKPFASPP
jgi:hypothetical protein